MHTFHLLAREEGLWLLLINKAAAHKNELSKFNHSEFLARSLVSGAATAPNRTGGELRLYKEGNVWSKRWYELWCSLYSTFPSLCWRCCPILAHPACDLTGRGRARCVDALFITEPDSKHLFCFHRNYTKKKRRDFGSIWTLCTPSILSVAEYYNVILWCNSSVFSSQYSWCNLFLL